ncbi:MAG: DUF3343 domain-containing protein [Prevotellaceae bacterium]|jgi:hypothetical protein|nr:DUF3343 domain-containing protein [Prevotellaceae bacterium]
MYIVFYSTSNVFKAEELLINGGISCEVVPTPVQDKAYCGVCIKTDDANAQKMLENMEFKVIEEAGDVI